MGDLFDMIFSFVCRCQTDNYNYSRFLEISQHPILRIKSAAKFRVDVSVGAGFALA